MSSATALLGPLPAASVGAACAHCGEPLPKAAGRFCCAGCQAAFATIQQLGLGSYYVRRALDSSLPRPRPEELPDVDFASQARAAKDGQFGIDLVLDGLQCAACVWLIETVLGREPDVTRARVNVTTRRLHIGWDGPARRAGELAAIVAGLGYHVVPAATAGVGEVDPAERRLLRSLAVAGFAAGNIMLLSVAVWAGEDNGMGPATRDLLHWISGLIAIPAVMYAGQPFFRSALNALRHARTNMDVPISIGILVTSALSLVETALGGEHAYFDSVVMLLFFLLGGRYLEYRARAKARAAIDHFQALRVGAVTVLDADGNAARKSPEAVRPGDLALVASGERIGIDGTIVDGQSSLDTSIITGEATPRPAGPGNEVNAGMINLGGVLKIRVTGIGENTLLAELARLLDAAEQERSRFVALAERVSRLYAPVVHIAALATLLAWLALGADFHAALVTAVSVLIITCPCALALAIPAVQMVAIGRLLKSGVLVKSGTALERLAAIDTIVFDKTGTLTIGRPVLVNDGQTKSDLKCAASLATASRHPLARALVAAAGSVAPATDASEHQGQGISAGAVRLGSRAFAGIAGQADDDASELWLVRPGIAPVRFRFRDQVRSDAGDTVARLHAGGYRVVLLSGDHPAAVRAIAEQLRIAEWQAALPPAAKVAFVQQLAAGGARVLMVGDGINDAPALAAAHASLAPATGADISQAAADAVFQGTLLSPVRVALAVAGKARSLVRQNLALALGYNVLAVPAAMLGYVTPLVAAVSMSASSLIVIANAMRAGAKDAA